MFGWRHGHRTPEHKVLCLNYVHLCYARGFRLCKAIKKRSLKLAMNHPAHCWGKQCNWKRSGNVPFWQLFLTMWYNLAESWGKPGARGEISLPLVNLAREMWITELNKVGKRCFENAMLRPIIQPRMKEEGKENIKSPCFFLYCFLVHSYFFFLPFYFFPLIDKNILSVLMFWHFVFVFLIPFILWGWYHSFQNNLVVYRQQQWEMPAESY